MSSAQQKAFFLESKLGQFAVRTTDIPKAGPGEVLVKVEAAALNPLDWAIQAFGVFVEKYPAVLGCDGAGTVVQLGEGVTSLVVGDRIAFQGTIDAIGHSITGTFAQYTTTPAKLAVKLPTSVTFESAASMPCTLPTAAFPLYNPAGPIKLVAPWAEGGKGKYSGKSALVVGGSSSIGQYVIQFARLSGFSPIITTASLHNAEYLISLGATHVIDRTLPTDTVQAKAEDLAGGPFDLVYDAVSTPDTMPLAYALTSPRGDMVVVSPPSNFGGDEEPKKKVHMARGLLALPGNEDIGASLLGSLPALLEAGELKPNRTEVLAGGLNAIARGLERLKNKQVSGIKLVVLPQEAP